MKGNKASTAKDAKNIRKGREEEPKVCFAFFAALS
jgi:hypothetical protein